MNQMMTLVYNRERTEITEEEHALANELTEAIAAYLDGKPGNEMKESLDVGMAIGKMLMFSSDPKINSLFKLIRAVSAAGNNAIIQFVEDSNK